MPSISSERVSWNRRASAAILRAYESAPTRVAWKRPLPAHDEAAREHLVARVLVDRVALTGEQRLVDVEPDFVAQQAVARDLVAGTEIEQVVEHDLFDGDLRDVRRRGRPERVAHSAPRADRACAWRAAPG